MFTQAKPGTIQSNMDFLIKKCDAGDAAALSAIENACFSVPWSENALLESLQSEKYIFLSAVSCCECVGYVGAFCVLDEAYVTNIGVLPGFRKNGIGRALIERLISECKESGSAFLSLEVRVGNKNAVALYEKSGFVLSGRRKDFYENPREDGLIYTYFFGE